MHITSKSRWSPTSRTRLMLACGFWCIPTLILSMVQIDKPTYLFPEGTDSVIGLTAMMCDYYSMLDYAHVARAVVVHKFCHVGSFAFIGGGSVEKSSASGGSTTSWIHSGRALKGQLWRLRDPQGKPPGVVGWWPSRAVINIFKMIDLAGKDGIAKVGGQEVYTCNKARLCSNEAMRAAELVKLDSLNKFLDVYC
ncbi:uncharacterized protein LOC133714369 isoform X5 [Rosa rugosa]|uniref:uncharacterized protein LOC133714369 isoform X5 n=1 Tax=Rosa rugosa TaxID=74645 RepID=UPI002B416B52|nr:uncharacterized protein LOC133714369 isoform X5 [Rosa rugosa]